MKVVIISSIIASIAVAAVPYVNSGNGTQNTTKTRVTNEGEAPSSKDLATRRKAALQFATNLALSLQDGSPANVTVDELAFSMRGDDSQDRDLAIVRLAIQIKGQQGAPRSQYVILQYSEGTWGVVPDLYLPAR